MAKQPSPEHRPQPSVVVTRRYWMGLLWHLVLLGAFAFVGFFTPIVGAFSWLPESGNWIGQALLRLVMALVRDAVLFMPLAFFVAACSYVATEQRSWRLTIIAFLVGITVSIPVSWFVRSAMAGSPLHSPSAPMLVMTLMLCVLGSWAGATWRRSQSFLGWVACLVTSCVTVALVGIFLLVRFGLEPSPLELDWEPITSDERRALVGVFREHDPRKLKVNETTQLELSEKQINQLLTLGFSIVPGQPHAVVGLNKDEISFAATASIPGIPKKAKQWLGEYVNVEAAGKTLTRNGELGFQPSEFRVGKLPFPQWLLALSGPMMVDGEWHNEWTRPFFSAFRQVDVDPQRVSISYGHLKLKQGFVRDALVGVGAIEDLGPVTQVHVESLIEFAQASPSFTFENCVQSAFAKAQERSATEDPIQENRAAILALGYLIGHNKVKSMVGPELADVPPEVQKRFRNVSMHGRKDWARHFTLSAALEILSNKLASYAIGVLKEELDADGGSGFSFADLMADRAGTELAALATQSESVAKKIQSELSGDFTIDDVMPNASDLPENLPKEEFAQKFGDTNDPRYTNLVRDIDRRINTCRIHRR